MNETFALNDGITTIGRDSDNDIQLMSPEVSRHHAQIHNLPSVCDIEDLDSANGTYINGDPITKRNLREGHDIRIGDCVLRFELCSSDLADGSPTAYEYSDRSRFDTVMIRMAPSSDREDVEPDEPEPVAEKPAPTMLRPLRRKEQ